MDISEELEASNPIKVLDRVVKTNKSLKQKLIEIDTNASLQRYAAAIEVEKALREYEPEEWRRLVENDFFTVVDDTAWEWRINYESFLQTLKGGSNG